MSTENTRQETAQAARQSAEADFARLQANRDNGVRLPEDGTLRGAWLAAYATRFADLAEPYAIEGRLIAAGRAPCFHAGQRIEFASFDSIALGRGEWRAGEVDSYYDLDWQPVYGPGTLRLDVRVTGQRDKPIGKPIAVSEFQVRVPQGAKVPS